MKSEVGKPPLTEADLIRPEAPADEKAEPVVEEQAEVEPYRISGITD